LAEHGWKLREIGEDGIKKEGVEGNTQGKCKKVANCWWNTYIQGLGRKTEVQGRGKYFWWRVGRNSEKQAKKTILLQPPINKSSHLFSSDATHAVPAFSLFLVCT